MSNYKNIFDLARTKFQVVGITGMCASGLTRMVRTIWSSPLLTARCDEGLTQNVTELLSSGDNSLKQILISAGFTPALDESNKVVFDESTKNIIENLLINNETLYEDLNNYVVDHIMSKLATRLQNIMNMNSGVTKNLNIQLFVELPLCTNLNYNDYCDELVVVTRPQTYNESDWWINFKSKGCCYGDCSNTPYYDLCLSNIENTIKFVQKSDNVWNKISMNPTTIFDNFGTEEDFAGRILTYIENKKKITLATFNTYLPTKG